MAAGLPSEASECSICSVEVFRGSGSESSCIEKAYSGKYLPASDLTVVSLTRFSIKKAFFNMFCLFQSDLMRNTESSVMRAINSVLSITRWRSR